MTDSLLALQVGLWLFAAAMAFLAIFQSRRFLEKEKRLPLACGFENLQAQVDTKRAELVDFQQRVLDARDLIASRDRAVAEEKQARAWIEDNKEQLLKFESERQRQEAMREELAALQEKLSLQDEVLQRKSDQRDKLSGEVQALELSRSQVAAELKAFREKAKEEEEGVARLEEQTDKLKHNLKGLQAEMNSMLEESERVNRARQEAVKKLDEANKAIVAAEEKHYKRIAELKTEFAREEEKLQRRMTELKASIGEEEAKLQGLRTASSALEAHIENLKGMRDDLRKDLARHDAGPAEERYQDLWKPVWEGTGSRAQMAVEESEALETTSNYISGQGLKFPSRVLYAFHTALKINKISPLAVLAGISGTGKSALPRFYAEGMGMHFVMLAVQPRWDSPQDLFGFYNYLERRYKATELARAFVQFERHNRKDWPLPKDWDHARDDRMLLVLLDEMNLARVEYYFSEFLSKLETRRGIDVEDPDERAKAEIALEMGSLATQDKAIRLFPDSNVLFSGTMNEDETTQTLSDKVLDRACVLRFGRPRKIETKSIGTIEKTPASSLSFRTWQKWLVHSNSDRLPQVETWISNLNDAMDLLGRPFGHRVGQAIHDYVASYPSWVARRIEMAMADQIEQRILPKLRGVEVEESRRPLDQIGAVIKELGDDQLSQAYEKGHKDQDTFIWRGIDRSED